MTMIDINCWERGCACYDSRIADETVEVVLAKQGELVAWPCLIAETNFLQNTVTLIMQCEDYKVSAEQHWLSTTPQQRTWVGLTDEEIEMIVENKQAAHWEFIRQVEAKLKEKNNG